MTTFNLPDPDSPAPTDQAPALLSGDPFYPSIDPAKFTAIMRLVVQVTPDRVTDALVDAMLTVDRDEELAARKAAWIEAGHATLAAVPAPEFGGEHRLVFLYRRAVYSFAKAALDEKFRDNATSDAGERRAEGVDVVVGSHRRNAQNALADLVGRSRSNVDLI